jgi:predicted amidohydrolase
VAPCHAGTAGPAHEAGGAVRRRGVTPAARPAHAADDRRLVFAGTLRDNRRTMPSRFTIGVAQIGPRLGDVAANLDLHEASLREAKGRGIDLLVFPELSLTGYFLKDMVSTVALAPDAPALRRLRALSRDTVPFVVGLVEETPEFRFYNAAMLVDGGEIRHVHRKVYPPTYGLFDELRYLARGTRIAAFDSRFGRLAILLCEDMWHASTAYIAAMDGALLVLVPSASPIQGIARGEIPENAAYWQRLNVVTAESYGMFIVHANRVGFEDGIGFWGGSEIVAPSGELLARGRYYEPDMPAAEISLGAARRKRITAPMLRDENLDVTINELTRIRGRELAGVVKELRRQTLTALAAPVAKRTPAPAAKGTSTPAAKRTPGRAAKGTSGGGKRASAPAKRARPRAGRRR